MSDRCSPVWVDRAQKDIDLALLAHAVDVASRAPAQFDLVFRAKIDAEARQVAERAGLWDVKGRRFCATPKASVLMTWRSEPKLSANGAVRLRSVGVLRASADLCVISISPESCNLGMPFLLAHVRQNANTQTRSGSQRLVITEDPQTALHKLFKKKASPESKIGEPVTAGTLSRATAPP
jgi:hypothetical protein